MSVATPVVMSHLSGPGIGRSGGSASTGPIHTWTPWTLPSDITTGSVLMTRSLLGVMLARLLPLATVSAMAVWMAARFGFRRRNAPMGTRLFI